LAAEAQAHRQIEELAREVAEQKALLQRLIAQGAPSQTAEDRLRKLEQKLLQMKRQCSQE
jgi:transcription termination factor NusB